MFNSCVLLTNPVGCFLCNTTGWRLQPMRGSCALVSPPPMSSRHRILEPSGRWHSTLTSRNSNLQHTNLKWAAAATITHGHTIQYYQLNFFLHLIIITSTFTHLYVAWVRDRSLFMTGGGPEENRFFRENFSRPTQRADQKFRGPLDIAR